MRGFSCLFADFRTATQHLREPIRTWKRSFMLWQVLSPAVCRLRFNLLHLTHFIISNADEENMKAAGLHFYSREEPIGISDSPFGPNTCRV